MSDISRSKLPEGKVLMWQMYLPSSETSVLAMISDESKVGSSLLKRTRRAHVPNATKRESTKKGGQSKEERERDVEGES